MRLLLSRWKKMRIRMAAAGAVTCPLLLPRASSGTDLRTDRMPGKSAGMSWHLPCCGCDAFSLQKRWRLSRAAHSEDGY